MKILTLFALVFGMLISTCGFSQIRVGLGAIGGFPSGEFADLNDYGLGAYLEGRIVLNDKIELGLRGSAIGFAEVDILSGGIGEKTVIIPVLLTCDYILLDQKWTPYLGLGLGSYIIDSGMVQESRFGFEPNAGVLLGSMNIGVGYHVLKDFNYLSLQIGYLSR